MSGKPKGHPATAGPNRTAANTRLDQTVLEEALRPIQIRENDKVVELPMIQAVVRSLGVSAVKGHHASQLALAAMVKAAQTQQLKELLAAFSAARDYKKRWRTVFDACDKAGGPRPEPVPILTRSCSTRRRDMVAENAELRTLVDQGDEGGFVADDIAHNLRIMEIIDAVVPDEETRRRPGFDLQRWCESQPGHAHLTAAEKEHRRRER